MLYRYIAVISEAEGVFYAKVPDIVGCITTANNLQEAIMLITDALNLALTVLEDENIHQINRHYNQRFNIIRVIF